MPDRPAAIMDWTFLEHPARDWFGAAAIFVAVAFGVPIIRAIIRGRCINAGTNDRSWRGLVGELNARWMRSSTLLLGIALASLPLATDSRVMGVAKLVIVGTLAVQLFRLVPVLVNWGLRRVSGAESPGAEQQGTLASIAGVRWVVLFAAYAIILLLALQNLGVNVTSLIAGLGIGGIAVALAIQNLLGDLFASLTISLDKPFVAGDFIIVGDEKGTVEQIGLKTTRVRSLSGEQLVFGNADLLSSRIRNYKRMNERRVVFGFGVVYATPPETLEQINTLVRSIVESQPNVRFDRCHFHRFGVSSLDFEVVYSINSPDYNTHMDVQQAIHLAIARAFIARGIEFAYPTQTLYIARGPA